MKKFINNGLSILIKLIGVAIILCSSPLGYNAIKIVYLNQNLVTEFVPLLNGFIHSFMIIGILIFILGFTINSKK